ncbi:hypothetical protein GCM10020000_76640 [Streptomyces olivoverticillatus]
MLHDAHRTRAPNATRVSIRTAVCTVICSEPVIRALSQRLRLRVLLTDRHQTGHLMLGESDLLTTESRQRQVRDLEILEGSMAVGGS